jgi:hypothetical protein
MKIRIRTACLLVALVALTVTRDDWMTYAKAAGAGFLAPAPNEVGVADTVHSTGAIDRTNPFFLELGINGRTCATCHDARAGWTITPALMQQAFDASAGLAAPFRIHDAGNRPDADLSTVDARRKAFSTLLEKGLIRFARRVAATAEFEVTEVDDPHGWSTPSLFSNFRRPNPLSPESLISSTTWTGGPHNVRTQLVSLMNGATRFHAQRAGDVPVEQREAGADFMMGVFHAQALDDAAGPLDADGARGGPAHLMAQPPAPGANDPASGELKPKAFDLYDAWQNADAFDRSDPARRRAQIARGQKLFNAMELEISGVAGLNDVLGVPVIRGTCSTCHNAPNVGSHSVFRQMNIGTADKRHRTSDIPLLTVRERATGKTMESTDLGRATGTGRWADIGKFKVPQLRGLAARAPYFHNGSARDLKEVLEFYNDRFGINRGSNDIDDLRAFLEAL